MGAQATQDAPTCARCRQPLPKEVTFCAACGFDNGEFLRMGRRAAVDQKIEEHHAWQRFKQFFFPWWLR